MYIEQKQDRILKPHSVYTKSAEEDNQITTELLNLITEAGLTPSADDLTQVKTAVLSLGGGGNDKADTDLSNLTAAGDIYGSKLSMPSSVNENITIGSSGANYIAPSNGWVHAQGQQTSSGGWIALVSSSGIITRAQTSYNNSIHNIYIPVKKGDTFQLHWTNVGGLSLTFIYAEGSKTEAN